MVKKTRETIIADLKAAEGEEGRTGLVEAYLKENPEKAVKKEVKKDKK